MTLHSGSAAPGEAQPKAKIFISYCREDMAFVDRLDAALKARGLEPLIDRTEIYAFEDWWQRIQSLITQADTIIFVLSPDAVSSDICAQEVAFAASLHKRFAPVVCKRVDDDAVPEPLRRLNFIFCGEDARLDASMDQLAEALTTDIGWIRKHTEFGTMARRWEIAGRPGPRGLLLRSPLLEEAERWIESRPQGAPEPTPTMLTFITDSRRAAKQRRVRAIASIFGITLIVGLGATAWFEREYLKLRWQMWSGPSALKFADERTLKPKQEFRECARCPMMVVVPSGEFMMGSKKGVGHSSEYPQHNVTIANAFAVAKLEVTFDEWDVCYEVGGCKLRPGDQGWGRGSQPVINVSWDDAQEYVTWLSKQTGKNYRLLSEAEWEYAARSGTTTLYPWGDEVGTGNANCNCEERLGTIQNNPAIPTGSLAPNAFGLHDMHGNVAEWVQDCYQADYDGAPTDGSAWTEPLPGLRWANGICRYRVSRGGSWADYPGAVTSASRKEVFSDNRLNDLGFRVARTLNQ
jgi:formylglycine-generating enzyme required for sulfatase activity